MLALVFRNIEMIWFLFSVRCSAALRVHAMCRGQRWNNNLLLWQRLSSFKETVKSEPDPVPRWRHRISAGVSCASLVGSSSGDNSQDSERKPEEPGPCHTAAFFPPLIIHTTQHCDLLSFQYFMTGTNDPLACLY